MDPKVVLLVVLSVITLANGAKYELLILDEDIFSSCPDPADGTLDVNGLFDLSELTTSMDANGITVSGNATLKWDIQLEDRVQMDAKLLYMDRGTWTPTMLGFTAKDFCKVMYEKNPNWYKYWTQYIRNDVKDKCLNAPGTKFIYETYVLNLSESVTGSLREGRYKLNFMFRAYDSSGTERPTRICFESQGDLFKV
ncbi:uncharacterized protein [Drosophila takahashii]|uniref:uncharacterized protein n=1 Tax=Drosophila takahashii TaxID=29030 RepID=UPI001CF82CFD|nr:uncharacterized protein LOC108063563 [Drosophila takahashii]